VTPEEESRFVALWHEGLTTDAIAEALGIPQGTAHSRAYTLQQQGKIAPRPKGGRRTRAVHAPVQNSAVQTTMHGAEMVQSSAERPIPGAIATEFMRLWAAIDVLRNDLHPSVQDTVQSLPEPLFEDPADNTTERWNLYLKHGLGVRIEELAQARGVAPSRVVQEILWHALTDRRAPPP
jgi:hypothetical protein